MPIYEYQCTACQHQLTALQNISDPILRTCPVCTRETLEKLISRSSIQFKGSGWYVTDFGLKSKQKPALLGSDAGSAESGDKDAPVGEAGSDPKAATAPSESTATQAKDAALIASKNASSVDQVVTHATTTGFEKTASDRTTSDSK